jgi:hypothetical protein
MPFKRGQSGNPEGRPKGALNKATADIREAAQEYSAQALQVLVNVATTGESEAARVAAANAILDRAHGKPKQSVDVDANVKAAITEVRRTIVRPSHSNG